MKCFVALSFLVSSVAAGQTLVMGPVTSVHFAWLQAGCPGVVKIKFFRRSGNSVTMTDERGPLGSVATDTVQQGDLIGITELSQCGNPMLFGGSAGQLNLLRYAADITGTVDVNAAASTSFNIVAVNGSGPATRSRASSTTRDRRGRTDSPRMRSTRWPAPRRGSAC